LGLERQRRRRGLSLNPTLGAGIRRRIARTIFRLCRSTLSYGFTEVGGFEPASRPRGLLCHSSTSTSLTSLKDSRLSVFEVWPSGALSFWEVENRYRSQCRPGTGAASRKCQAPTGANVESVYRNYTAADQVAELVFES
jgi:hypothetical protein